MRPWYLLYDSWVMEGGREDMKKNFLINIILMCDTLQCE